MHVHVAVAEGTAKFWLEPIVALASYHNLKARDLRQIESIVEEHEDEFRDAWRCHFEQ